MPIVNVTLPSDGTGADVGDYNPAILAILAVLNGHIASDNIEPGSLDWSVMSGTMTNVIPSTAMQDSGSAEKFRAESKIGFSASGLVWSALTGLNATMTAGIQYTPDGLRRSISAVTSRAFTASKDTYISVSPAGALSYQEVANNAAQPALGTDYRWLAKVVTSVSAITSVTDMRQTGVIGSQNIDWGTLQKPLSFNVGNGTITAGGLIISTNYEFIAGRPYLVATKFFQVNGTSGSDIWTATLTDGGTTMDTYRLSGSNFQRAETNLNIYTPATSGTRNVQLNIIRIQGSGTLYFEQGQLFIAPVV